VIRSKVLQKCNIYLNWNTLISRNMNLSLKLQWIWTNIHGYISFWWSISGWWSLDEYLGPNRGIFVHLWVYHDKYYRNWDCQSTHIKNIEKYTRAFATDMELVWVTESDFSVLEVDAQKDFSNLLNVFSDLFLTLTCC